jgi:hypothetical protein
MKPIEQARPMSSEKGTDLFAILDRRYPGSDSRRRAGLSVGRSD